MQYKNDSVKEMHKQKSCQDSSRDSLKSCAVLVADRDKCTRTHALVTDMELLNSVIKPTPESTE